MVRLDIPRGMRDLEPCDYADLSFVRDRFLETARLFNFRPMEPSPLELVSVLEAKSGEGISNEIYSFKDKGDRDVALRFDLTIGLTRNVASRRDLKMPLKLASFAGVWRYDEPQAGRYRFFHQWDVEIYGPFSTESDAEVIEFVSVFFRRLGLAVNIEINDRRLIEQFIRKSLGVVEESQVLELFRAVDKVPKKGADAVIREYAGKIEPSKLQALIELSGISGSVEQVAAKTGVSALDAWKDLAGLMDSLSSRGVKNARINLGIVRGLDYYSGIVFEVFDQSAKEGALVGGGRYDRLTEAFGRKEIGATGAAGGVERIVLAMRRSGVPGAGQPPLVYIAYASEELRRPALELTTSLRGAGLAVEYDLLGRSLRKQLEDASGKGARAAVILAPQEYASGQLILRSLATGDEARLAAAEIRQALEKTVRA